MSRSGQRVILDLWPQPLDRPEKMSVRSRRWCFTWFPTEDEEVPPEFEETWMTYLITGRELCPTTGKVHWQGYLETGLKTTLTGIKSKGGLWEYCHLEKARGSSWDSQVYCTKDGDYYEWGTPMQQGKRTDLAKLVGALVEGETSLEEILLEEPQAYHQYGRTLERVDDVRLLQSTRGEWAPPVVSWFWGDTGAGKSRTAMEQAKALNLPVYRHEWDDNGWWDTYRGEKVIIFDEFRGQVPFHTLLRWLDGYEFKVKRRGRMPQPFLGTHIFITSSKPPEDIYDREKLGEDTNQLLRRITHVVHFQKF
nr:Rep [Forsythia suspensa CRESS virus]QKI28992.1 Rep [Trichosanthes kirilowii CRESS virus]